jgi:hypothetical protein
LVEYAAYMLTRAEVGADGKTAYERSRGKVAKLAGVEFGEGGGRGGEKGDHWEN